MTSTCLVVQRLSSRDVFELRVTSTCVIDPKNSVRVEALICKRATKSVVVTLPIWVGGEAQLTMLGE
jgi:hypothetical protein